jgi:formylglycine-generating enzyme required for sulfatase activity
VILHPSSFLPHPFIMSRPLRVFLCHASQDKPVVWKLYRYLKQRGVKPWLDQADLLPGENWEVEIPNALLSSDVILVCLSKNSVDKEGYVQKEISFALDKALEKPEGTIFVIPVKLEECELPRRLNRYQWVELFRPDGRKRLLMGLNKRVKGLAPDVLPIIMEDTRRRRTVSKPVVDEPERGAMENAASEKAKQEAEEKAEREAAEKLAREKADQEAKEKAEREAAEKTAREKQEREQREKADREAKEKAEREQTEREAAERLARKEAARRQTIQPARKSQEVQATPQTLLKPFETMDTRLLALGGIILLGLLFWGISALLNREPAASPPEQTTATVTVTITPTAPTRTPTATHTPAPPTSSPTITPTPTLGIGSTMISEKDGMVLVFVPAGEFKMGSDTGNADEKPVHQVYLDAFWIDQTEVTNAMYARCVADGGCTPPSSPRSSTRSSYYGNSEFDDYPVIYVNWNQANVYCDWAGRSLPTEAQWEKAARGTDGRRYPWGESISCNQANYRNCAGDTTKVGSYLDGVSPYGMYDMAGNVWEWVNDWYDSSYYQTSPSSNPQGPTSGQFRVLRGGSWSVIVSGVRSVVRSWDDPSVTLSDFGFRCSPASP